MTSASRDSEQLLLRGIALVEPPRAAAPPDDTAELQLRGVRLIECQADADDERAFNASLHLRVPAGQAGGGRFWPMPHRPSMGRDLATDVATRDRLRREVKRARARFTGRSADDRLAAIGNIQGFDHTPTVMSATEMDRLLATGDYVEVWRGVKGFPGKTAAEMHEEMRTGPAYYGTGVFGHGYYFTQNLARARDQYSDGTKNSLVRALVPRAIKMLEYNEAQRRAEAISSPAPSGLPVEDGTLYNVGRYVAAAGFDAVEIPLGSQSPGGTAEHIASTGHPAYNVVNRSVLIVQEADP